MSELGRLEDLPADYVAALRAQNLVPLWPNLRSVLPPGKPIPNTRATHWSYQALRPLLLKAGELTPIEKAERRVLVLANPGHGLEKMQASAAMYLGMQLLLPGRGDRAFARGGVVPTPVFERSRKAYPMLRYPWADTRAALESLAADQPGLEGVQVTYVNPETGGDTENILGFYALMLRPGQTLRLPVRSPAMVFHVIEGGAKVQVEDQRFTLASADTCCAPGYTEVTLTNVSAGSPAFLFIADETPLHKKLGVFENRG